MGTDSKTSASRAVTAEIAGKLRHLYATEGNDCPESLLSAGPNAKNIVTALKRLLDSMFPGRNSGELIQDSHLEQYLAGNLGEVWDLLLPEVERAIPFRWKGRAVVSGDARRADPEPEVDPAVEAKRVLAEYFKTLPAIRSTLIEDVRAAYDGDPAALSFIEVKMAYPGILAITSHRLVHELYKLNVPIVPRVMSEWTHTRTGCDIHPGATIGKGFFIDHATGVVIGETAELGDYVKLYQGVTLGAKSFPLDKSGRPIKNIKRHPTVEDKVVCYSHATILGGDTVIGAGSVIGGNVFLMKSVPSNSFVVQQNPEPLVKTDRKK